jgi:diazepam-binding inhibitor (GABA receptor modulator, acyl-CoA-binding protein)
MAFEAAVEHVRALPKDGPVQLDNETRLVFYSLFKQANEGDVKGTQPWAVQMEARAKWDAWNGRKGMSSDDAKAAYVAKLVEITAANGAPWTAPA